MNITSSAYNTQTYTPPIRPVAQPDAVAKVDVAPAALQSVPSGAPAASLNTVDSRQFSLNTQYALSQYQELGKDEEVSSSQFIGIYLRI